MLAATPAPVDGARAYKYLKAICDLGPRPAGSEANAKQRVLVSKHFAKHGGKVREQPFTGSGPEDERAGGSMVNLVGSWHPERKDRVVIGATTTPARFRTRTRIRPGGGSLSSARTTARRGWPC